MSMWPRNYEEPVEHKSMIRFGDSVFIEISEFFLLYGNLKTSHFCRDLREKGDFDRKKIMPIKGREAIIGRIFGIIILKVDRIVQSKSDNLLT